MKTYQAVALTFVAGLALGGITVHGIHAQAQPPVFYVGEIDVTDEAGYQRDFAPQAAAAVASSGGRYIARGGKTATLLGDPVKNRVVIQQWDSMDQLKKWFDSPEQTQLRTVQAKYSKVRAYSVEGLAAR